VKGAGLTLSLLLAGATVHAQSWPANEWRVNSEREQYERVVWLAAGGAPEPAMRPYHIATALPWWQPWRDSTADSLPSDHVRALAPIGFAVYNGAFPWATTHGVWLGRGLTAGAIVGAAARYRWFTARLQPVVSYAVNLPFELENPSAGFADPVRPFRIDHPQRFGGTSLTVLDAGESFLRADLRALTLGISNERLFWGPEVRHSLILSGQTGFPHLFVGTNRAVPTPIGRFAARLVYGRLTESEWAPPAPTPLRFGSGMVASWLLPGDAVEVGGTRFFHREWPHAFTGRDLLAPFGSLFFDDQFFAGGAADNQLASVFGRARFQRAHFEIFGEFGRNDRSSSQRDLLLEPEHNSAWILGFLKAFALDSSRGRLWSARLEAANGRISPIQHRTRIQASFFEHTPITQGHTQHGLLLGTPLIERATGLELSVDRWSREGRAGVTLFQRQMPPDDSVGVRRDLARTQWDLSASALRFTSRGSVSLRTGIVFDLGRFPGRDARNLYVQAEFSPLVNRKLAASMTDQ